MMNRLKREITQMASDTGRYDILILDASHKQSARSARNLGQAGLRVALGASVDECPTPHPLPAFRSKYSACSVLLPSYASEPTAYGDRVLDFARQHHTSVVLPTGDASIAAMAPRREELAKVGCTLAVAPDAVLEIATDKTRTLEVADKLGIAYPRSIQIDGPDDLPVAAAEFGFPFVLKPTVSWTGKADCRVVPVGVIDSREALDATVLFQAAGASIIAQEFASGRREGVSLFLIDGEVLAYCGHVAHRTSPPMGGVSVMRESIGVSDEVLDASVRLAKAIGLEGPCEVEFRRNADGRPLLMEINPRLAGTLENAVRSGVDFPLMVWHWASGQSVSRVESYRTGVRTRWLHGDLRWLHENLYRNGRPDTVPRPRGVWLFASEFARTRHYDYIDFRDPGPAIAELQGIVRSFRDIARRK
jgi:predicted ATP-grasp superfamily ATP-dependent carboligase